MIYDICAVLKDKDKKQEKSYQFLADASNSRHLNLLLDKHLPKGAEIINISVNPEIEEVHVINPKGDKIIKVVTIDSEESGEDKLEYWTYCIASSINEVLSKINEFNYDDELIEITIFTDNISYIY